MSGSSTAAYTETFAYDGFGNLTGKTLNGTLNAIGVDPATNRLTSAVYDGNGNMTSGAGGSFSYDGANRMASAVEPGGGAEYYSYAPDGKRIYRMTVNGGSMTEEWTFWGAKGEKLAKTTGWGAQSIWFAGRLIWENGTAVFQDRLGTNRGGVDRFYPYGEEITATGNDREKFATYNRDSYTGLDYADQRFYASSYGRFNTADPYMASGGPSDPSSWNRYSYTRGDPINWIDPMGLFDVPCDPGNPVCEPGCYPDDPICGVYVPPDPPIDFPIIVIPPQGPEPPSDPAPPPGGAGGGNGFLPNGSGGYWGYVGCFLGGVTADEINNSDLLGVWLASAVAVITGTPWRGGALWTATIGQGTGLILKEQSNAVRCAIGNNYLPWVLKVQGYKLPRAGSGAGLDAGGGSGLPNTGYVAPPAKRGYRISDPVPAHPLY